MGNVIIHWYIPPRSTLAPVCVIAVGLRGSISVTTNAETAGQYPFLKVT